MLDGVEVGERAQDLLRARIYEPQQTYTYD